MLPPRPAPPPAPPPGARRQGEPPGRLLRLLCAVLVCSGEIAALADFSDELKNQTVCEGQELTLHCHPSKSLRIYAAAFGRRARDADLCASAARPPPFDCLSHSAAHLLARRCYGRPRCRVLVDSLHFGSPCPPGARKYLTVAYACVPRTILSALDPALAEPAPSPKQEDADGAGPEDPRESGVRRKEGVMVSSSLAAFAYIRAHPDRAALLFVSSVGVGLALTLCALVARVSCARDLQALRGARERLVAAGDGASEDSEDADGSEASSGSSLPGEPPGLRRTAHPAYTALEAAELAERIERREQIIQEIWMNSGLDTSVPRSTGPFY
uniref:Eva-1-like protein C n=1 Tax=Pipistrellus kuhlii TaxID=59472 RepID=A0A7J7R4G5_PIPKU|nr:eva-1-like protein C [Pipistrellus kuhlii]